MSRYADQEPECKGAEGPVIDLVIEARPRDLGGFSVRRVLPSMMRRLVGPFIFFDHMGPVQFEPGGGIGVRPHPHIALATITYLLEGEFVHRDSLGSLQPIRPGDVNWMVAGRGVVHSERTAPEVRERGARMHGIQTWVALPQADEEMEPRFEHHPDRTVPVVDRPGVRMRVIAGTAYGAKAPTGVLMPTLYVHARLEDGATLPIDEEHEERAVYVVDGAIECDGKRFEEGVMLVLRPRAHVSIRAVGETNVMLVGGAPIDGERHIFWNFVSSSKERLERAKADWREGRFPKIPGDDVEFIPLPEGS
ncbi:pirin family protein [Polyangium aurulentum]|uniref:pirin family protein n=1 Tax=Polyangium aurulentum TaxID=2567896 RepID=UPI0010ADD1AC|nr:pirin family protein [Polyangium aurulentum]UQA56758.1 pirin family protein [Polyangium aurulentum]